MSLRASWALRVIVVTALLLAATGVVTAQTISNGDTEHALRLIESQFRWLTVAAGSAGAVLCAAVGVLWNELRKERAARDQHSRDVQRQVDRLLNWNQK